MTDNIIIGVILLTIGINIVLKTVFGLDLPIFKWLLAAFLIAWGASLIIGYDEPLFNFNCRKSTVVYTQE